MSVQSLTILKAKIILPLNERVQDFYFDYLIICVKVIKQIIKINNMAKKETTEKNKASQMIDKLIGQAKEMKAKFDGMDKNTKKKVIAGVAGAIALLTALGLAKKMRKRKKAKKNNW